MYKRQVQRVGPLLIAGRNRRLRAAELSAVAVGQLLLLLVISRPTSRLDILENFLPLPSRQALSARLRHLQTVTVAFRKRGGIIPSRVVSQVPNYSVSIATITLSLSSPNYRHIFPLKSHNIVHF